MRGVVAGGGEGRSDLIEVDGIHTDAIHKLGTDVVHARTPKRSGGAHRRKTAFGSVEFNVVRLAVRLFAGRLKRVGETGNVGVP